MKIPTYKYHRIRVKSLYLAYITAVLGIDTRCLILEGWETRSYVAKMGRHCLRQWARLRVGYRREEAVRTAAVQPKTQYAVQGQGAAGMRSR